MLSQLKGNVNMYTQYNAKAEEAETILKRLAESWKERVAVRKEILDLDSVYQMDMPDFPEGYLPFGYDSRYLELPVNLRMNILSAAWIFYNEKTIAVEIEIVAPVCKLLLIGDFKNLMSATLKKTLSQTLVDEEYHTLMCLAVTVFYSALLSVQSVLCPCPVD